MVTLVKLRILTSMTYGLVLCRSIFLRPHERHSRGYTELFTVQLIYHRCANPNRNLMFKTNLRTIAQVSAIATAIKWGCQSVPASSQDLWPSSFTTIPRTEGDRPILLDGITPSHLDIAVPGLIRYRYLEETSAFAQPVRQHKPLARYSQERARGLHSKNVPDHCGKRYILHSQKVQARLPQFAEAVQLDRVALGQSQVTMPELYARVQDR